MSCHQLLAQKLSLLAAEPGVYLMKDRSGRVIYVGKASSLRQRVRSYFQSPAHLDLKTRHLVQDVCDFECIVAENERAALVLEDTLIKKHQPRYNIRLKDDKNYPYIKITNEPFPRLEITRRIERDGARYFGPYTDSVAVRETTRRLQKLFRIRTCNLNITGKVRSRPCLDHYLGLCDAPCVGAVSTADYEALVTEAGLYLRGQHEELVPRLEQQMHEAVRALEFERAARLRDQIHALERLLGSQKRVDTARANRDVIAYARLADLSQGEQLSGSELCCVQVFFVRQGKIVGRERFALAATASATGTEILTAFVKQFYARATEIPPQILLQEPIADAAAIARWLGELRRRSHKPVRLVVPVKGAKRQLIATVRRNAELALMELQLSALQEAARKVSALGELQSLFSLPAEPNRVEAYDISSIQGQWAIGAMVAFARGKPEKSAYRLFRVRGSSGPDDFAMIGEVLRRRLVRAIARDDSFLPFPDLILIDGGLGQLHSARRALRELGLEKIPAISLAKQLDEIYCEDRSGPLRLPRTSPALQLLQRARDEAHRFANTAYRRMHRKAALHSVLDEISGIGPQRKKLLLRHFGSLRQLAGASVEELAARSGLSRSLAERVLSKVSGSH